LKTLVHVTWRWWVTFAQLSCVALCAYVAAYYATVCPVRPLPGRTIAFEGRGPWHSYRIGAYALPWYEAHLFFGPIHVIDRKLRPKTWWDPED
jgi:hypothetical protein